MILTKAPRIGSSLNACTEKEHTDRQKCPHLKIHVLHLKAEVMVMQIETKTLWERIFGNLASLFVLRMSSLDLRTPSVGRFVKGMKSSFDESE